MAGSYSTVVFKSPRLCVYAGSSVFFFLFLFLFFSFVTSRADRICDGLFFFLFTCTLKILFNQKQGKGLGLLPEG